MIRIDVDEGTHTRLEAAESELRLLGAIWVRGAGTAGASGKTARHVALVHEWAGGDGGGPGRAGPRRVLTRGRGERPGPPSSTRESCGRLPETETHGGSREGS